MHPSIGNVHNYNTTIIDYFIIIIILVQSEKKVKYPGLFYIVAKQGKFFFV